MYKRNNYEQPVFHIWAKQIYIYFVMLGGALGPFYNKTGLILLPSYPLTHINIHNVIFLFFGYSGGAVLGGFGGE